MSNLERAFDYLWNADPQRGRVSVAHFDDDHEPIGSDLRAQLVRKRWVRVSSGFVEADRPPRKYWNSELCLPEPHEEPPASEVPERGDIVAVWDEPGDEPQQAIYIGLLRPDEVKDFRHCAVVDDDKFTLEIPTWRHARVIIKRAKA